MVELGSHMASAEGKMTVNYKRQFFLVWCLIIPVVLDTFLKGRRLNYADGTTRTILANDSHRHTDLGDTVAGPDDVNIQPQVPLFDLSESPDLKCGMNYSDFLAVTSSWKELHASQKNAQNISKPGSSSSDLLPFAWTTSGGEKYSVHLPMILGRWKRLGMHPVAVMALDTYTADLVCALNTEEESKHFAILWDQPKLSYSRVADVKFEVPAVMVDAGIPSFFIEPDIFCRRNPLPIFVEEMAANSSDDQVQTYRANSDKRPFDLIHLGHKSPNWYPNIGAYLVQPNPEVATFFRNTRQILNHRDLKFFDQHVYYVCLPERAYERGSRRSDKLIKPNSSNYDYVDECQRNVTSFRYKAISNEIMSYAPAITENTHCIHPLLGSPGMPFEAKLLLAKYDGFDPDGDIWDGQERFLRFYGGDLTMNACYDIAMKGHTLPANKMSATVFRFKYQLSALIALAMKTNRTVILPRNVKSLNGHVAQLPLLVSVLSIEKLTKYRFHTPKPLLDPEDGMPHKKQPVYVAQDDHSLDYSVQAIQQYSKAPLVAIDHACLLTREEESGEPTIKTSQVMFVMNQLRWCIGVREIVFHEGTHGIFDKYCERFYSSNAPGVTW